MIFKTLIKAPFVILGAILTLVVVVSHFEWMPTFVEPSYEHFWDDLASSFVRDDPSAEEFLATYQSDLAREAIASKDLGPGLFPSEASAFAFWIGIASKRDGGQIQKDNEWQLFALGWFA